MGFDFFYKHFIIEHFNSNEKTNILNMLFLEQNSVKLE
jgi:hypothetical protein